MKILFKKLRNHRGIVQFFATLLSNLNVHNFFKGTIYSGDAKSICVPGLNCYSCPAATGACPIGAFQAVVGSSKFNFAYYVTGLILLFGVLVGRLTCGFLCPFGWFQDLLHKIPTKKFSTKKFVFLKYIKYFMLFFVVFFLGLLFTDVGGNSVPYFCKYICPVGILEGGIPLSTANSAIANAIGTLFAWKFVILIIIIILAVFFYRPFCKYICPLGAFYALLNRVSFYKYYIDKDKCINCGRCAKKCKMDVDICKNQSALECIRCGECINECPTSAISTSLSKK
ncbi:MAG: 4Fe-4S binding protein [Eubacteriales bacterium]|nr:4Fe-4S binding protein [Eubacteriales bacterium]MDY3333284.1 4Fe-4S binding protein [Gallibacter sp.]